MSFKFFAILTLLAIILTANPGEARPVTVNDAAKRGNNGVFVKSELSVTSKRENESLARREPSPCRGCGGGGTGRRDHLDDIDSLAKREPSPDMVSIITKRVPSHDTDSLARREPSPCRGCGSGGTAKRDPLHDIDSLAKREPSLGDRVSVITKRVPSHDTGSLARREPSPCRACRSGGTTKRDPLHDVDSLAKREPSPGGGV